MIYRIILTVFYLNAPPQPKLDFPAGDMFVADCETRKVCVDKINDFIVKRIDDPNVQTIRVEIARGAKPR